MSEDIMQADWIDEDLIREAVVFLFENLNLLGYKYLNIHFIPNILSDTCSVEIKELKDGYEMIDGIALVIITSNSDQEKDQWMKENDIPDSWNVFLDHDRNISKKFSNLNIEYDIPSRLSCLVNMNGKVFWSMKNGIGEKRDMLLSNKFNKNFENLIDITE